MLSEVLFGNRPGIREGGLEAGRYGANDGGDIAAGVWKMVREGLASVSVMGCGLGGGYWAERGGAGAVARTVKNASERSDMMI